MLWTESLYTSFDLAKMEQMICSKLKLVNKVGAIRHPPKGFLHVFKSAVASKETRISDSRQFIMHCEIPPYVGDPRLELAL